MPSDPDLAKLIAAWPTLPDAIKAGILAMVQSITPKADGFTVEGIWAAVRGDVEPEG